MVAAGEHALAREHRAAQEDQSAPVRLAEAVLRRDVLAGATVLATLAVVRRELAGMAGNDR